MAYKKYLLFDKGFDIEPYGMTGKKCIEYIIDHYNEKEYNKFTICDYETMKVLYTVIYNPICNYSKVERDNKQYIIETMCGTCLNDYDGEKEYNTIKDCIDAIKRYYNKIDEPYIIRDCLTYDVITRITKSKT